MSLLVQEILASLRDKSVPKKAAFLPNFFKAFPGGYGEGDQFLGVSVPDQRKIAKGFFQDISLDELSKLVSNAYHEVRLTGLLALVFRYEACTSAEGKQVLVDFYCSHLEYINNWDLVDTTCYRILGEFYQSKEKSLFYELAGSGHLWKERIAMISSLYWIKKGEFEDALALAAMLLNHPHDLIHKAVGWMLREIGKQDFDVELAFLTRHYPAMPRTALRYAIERFPEELRQDFLKNRV